MDIFPKGLTHGFGANLAIFRIFFYRQYMPGKCLLWYSRTKKRHSTLSKQEVQKVEYRNIGQENVFYDILERKNTFLGYKNMKSKKSKIWHFSKGVNPWFWSKNGHFSNFFFLGNICQENVFYDILERKITFLA